MAAFFAKAKARTATTTATQIECPFDLDAIFKSDVDRFAELRQVIQFIFENLNQNATRITEIDTKMVSKFMQINEIKVRSIKNKEDIEAIQLVNKELEQITATATEDISEMKSDLEAARMNLTLSNNRAKDLKNKHVALQEQVDNMAQLIAALEARPVFDKSQIPEAKGPTYVEVPVKQAAPAPVKVIERISGDNNLDMDQLAAMFASREQVANLEARLAELEQVTHQNIDPRLVQIENMEVAWSQNLNRPSDVGSQESAENDTDFQRYVSQMEANFASRFGELESMFENLGNTGNQPTGEIDTASLMILINKNTAEIKNRATNADLTKLQQQVNLKADQTQVRKEVQRLEELINQLRQAISNLDHKVDGMGRDLSELRQTIDILGKSIQGMRQGTVNVNQGNGLDEGTLRQIMERLANLEGELDNFKNEFGRWVKEFQDALNQKADIDTVKALEQSLLDRLNEIVKALSKQFADKNDTRKALKLLEKNLKNMYDLFMSKGGGHDNEDDAMFTKKPLGGTSCASCAKDVVDMYGKRVEYLPWGKLPFRDPSERIARVGQGFSKMLSMINPDHLSQYNNGQQQFQGHGQSQEGLQTAYPDQDQQIGNPKMMHGQGGPVGRTASNFNPQYKQTGMEHRPGSAQVKNHRPITRGASKKGRGY